MMMSKVFLLQKKFHVIYSFFYSSDFGFTEVIDGPLPCNGFPEYRQLPINQAFYLGAHNVGSHVFNKPCQGSQTQDISQMLEDGIRYLDINLCKE